VPAVTDPGDSGSSGDSLAWWQEAFTPLVDELQTVRMLVLSWGPGPHRPEYEKRRTIAEHLTATAANTDVRTSEELVTAMPAFQYFTDPLDLELIQAQGADLIICLVVPSAEVTGVRAELLDIRRNAHIVSKVRLLVPKGPPGQGLVDLGIRSIPSTQVFRYTPRQLIKCDDIRAKCLQWLEEARTAKWLLDKGPAH
jgi:hypothetical protein